MVRKPTAELSVKIGIAITRLNRAKLEVLARADRRTLSYVAADMLDAMLGFHEGLKVKLQAAAQKQLQQDPSSEWARTVLESYKLAPAPAPAPAPPTVAVPAPPSRPAPVPPTPQVAAEAAEDLSSGSLGITLEDLVPDGDASFLAPPNTTPSQVPIARAAYVPPTGEKQ